MSTYQGRPQRRPSISFGSKMPVKKSAGATSGEAATRSSSGLIASSATNSGTQVAPSWKTSGMASPA